MGVDVIVFFEGSHALSALRLVLRFLVLKRFQPIHQCAEALNPNMFLGFVFFPCLFGRLSHALLHFSI